MCKLLASLTVLLLLATSCTQPLPDQDWDFHLGLEVSFTTEPNHTDAGPVPTDKRPQSD